MAATKVKVPSEKLLQETRRMAEILKILKRTYPEAKCSLDYQSPYQLLVATILSAQCTDERVNKVTPVLFRRFGTPQAMAKADLHEIEKLIQSTGFFRSKAKALKESAQAIVELHEGQVPEDFEALVRLRGVGRKTANVVLGNAFGVPAMVVDTHVGRLARRMGFSRAKDPVQVEKDLVEVVLREDWILLPHLLIQHGREICTARRAYCEDCPVFRFCPKIGVSRAES